MKNLIGMVDFVLEINKAEESCREDFVKCVRYANFLKQPLELWMFVPCKLVDGVWVVLEEPDDAKDYIFRGDSMRHEDLQEYQQAKERCLFEGFEMDNSFVTHKSHNSFFYPISCLHEQIIEDLVKYNLELTQTAQI